ncbi:MAG: hypothetical protein EAZ89_17990 [Bacteroidetes bacterium]|jgi:hypothetical protein|nr:MAG: hypothetical protein EAZ89_17990 [Bacteroidota bacterium]
MKYILATALSFVLCTSLFAQEYRLAAGGRLGSANGFTLKYFAGEYTAIESIVAYRKEGIRVIALAEQHIPLGRRSQTSFFFGAGAHAGFTGLLQAEGVARPSYGADAIVGFEYVFDHSPVAVSVDIKPEIELHKGRVFSGNNAGLSLRFYLD